jgi:hypothetical protein
MAKKQKTQEVEVPIVETPVVETPKPKTKTKSHPEDGWVIKDRMYYLKNGRSPLTYLIRGSSIYWFDEEKGYERELKYTSNQRTCFVDEKTVLQKLLSIYHPQKDKLFEEYKPVEIAKSQIEDLNLEVDALLAARDMDIDMAEAIMRVELGSKVSDMSSKEIKRDLLLFAKKNPNLFLELASDDNVQLRNFGIKATELGIIKLTQDQRNFLWGSNDRPIMTVPFDEHPYTALAHWFKTDEGMEIYSNIEKRLK